MRRRWLVAAIETDDPALATARTMLDRFHHVLRIRDAAALTPWMAET
jgi:hypothetical protein